MSSIARKELKVPSGNTYSYLSLAPTTPEKPTLLLIHGFPSTAHDWRFQISYFASLGYGIIAPDNLGHGRTSHPRNVDEYIGSKMASDIIFLLDQVQSENETMTKGGKVIGISHDWGVYLLSQLAIYHEARFEKLVFISVAFIPPGSIFDVPSLNEATEKAIGYPIFGYWLFMSDDRAGEVIAKHVGKPLPHYGHHEQLSKTDSHIVGNVFLNTLHQ
jgi:soluble epoxide hydrolase/lipid-phosphate phosphatase